MKKLDYYIIGILTATAVFTGLMIWLFRVTGYVPDSLVNGWFIYVVGELLCCTLIKTVGDHLLNRKEALEDRDHYEQKEKDNGME